jgi:aspartate aminotransferase-like enzyme
MNMTRLFIPGPTDVNSKTLDAMRRPLIGHRTAEFSEMFARVQENLKHVLQTKNRVFITTSSGTGLFEGALRNTVSERVLICVCGAFGERWVDMAHANDLIVERVDSAWGDPNTPDLIAAKLKTQHYDSLAIVHNETSTGVENPIADTLAVVRELQPEIITIVDAVSSAGGVDIPTDDLGIDILVSSSQKCFALPPGLAFAAVSDRAMDRAKTIEHRGYYFDFLLLDKFLNANMALATPAVSLFFALDKQLEQILAEGIQERFNRHTRLASIVQNWALEHFDLYAAVGYRSKTLTTVQNTRNINITALNDFLSKYDMILGNGYGKLKDQTFRIAHMGDLQDRDLRKLLSLTNEFISIVE